jgi:hypothetical protein
MDPRAEWLVSPAAAGPLADARTLLASMDPLAAGAALRARHPTLASDLAAAALEQADLAQRARSRYGLDAPGLLLTRDGLEAATRPEVAARRARLLAAAGARGVVDLTGGLGFDASACADAGLAVTVVERDAATAAYLRHNCPAARIIPGDATDPAVLAIALTGLSPTDVVFVDPARRDPAGPRDRATGRARPERDPERWSPPWSFVAALPHPRVLAKVAPGFSPPPGWQAEWVSVGRVIVECAVASWPLLEATRQAVILDGDRPTLVRADDGDLPIAASVGAWVHEPDPAVLRAGALAALASQEELAGLDPDSTWLTGGRSCSSPAVRSHLVVAELAGPTRQQRRQLADLGVQRLTVKSRDVSIEPAAVLRSLGVREGGEHVLILTRRGGRSLSLLARPAAARSR